jgi:DNA-binding response OmpR family regulator
MASILLLSPHHSLARALASAMTIAGHDVLAVDHPKSAHGETGRRRFDLALLDVALTPLAEQVRTLTKRVVLFSTGAQSVSDHDVKSAGALAFVSDLGPRTVLDSVTLHLNVRV